MRLYWEVARTTARRMATYRAATVAGIITNTVFGFILAYVLLAVFREQPEIGGFDAGDAVTFTFVAQGMLMVVGIFGTDHEMPSRIQTGEVAMDLSRPYDFQSWWAAVAYGKAFFYCWARGIAPFVIGAVVFDLELPAAPAGWLWFLLSVAVAVGVTFAWGFILQLTAFWLVDHRGPNQIGFLLAQVLSGTFFPLVLLPDGVESIVRALPFAAMIQLPIEVFLGKHQGTDLVLVYATQLAWLAALAALGRLILSRAVRKVVIQGG